jgi:hypothetical protein
MLYSTVLHTATILPVRLMLFSSFYCVQHCRAAATRLLLTAVCAQRCSCWTTICLQPVTTLLLQLIMETTVHGGRSASGSSSSAAGSGNGSETLEQLSANALQQLLKLADATQQLAALFKLLPLEDGSFPPDEQQQQQQDQEMAVDGEQQPPAAATAAGTAPADAGAAVVAAVLPRLPQLTACIDKLMLNSCFKEAQTCVECLVLLGRQLNTPAPANSAAAGAAGGAAAGVQRQQQQVPAHAELSRWAAESALQQEEPEVKSVSLAKALLDVYIRFCGERIVVGWARRGYLIHQSSRMRVHVLRTEFTYKSYCRASK